MPANGREKSYAVGERQAEEKRLGLRGIVHAPARPSSEGHGQWQRGSGDMMVGCANPPQ